MQKLFALFAHAMMVSRLPWKDLHGAARPWRSIFAGCAMQFYPRCPRICGILRQVVVNDTFPAPQVPQRVGPGRMVAYRYGCHAVRLPERQPRLLTHLGRVRSPPQVQAQGCAHLEGEGDFVFLIPQQPWACPVCMIRTLPSPGCLAGKKELMHATSVAAIPEHGR